MKSANIEQGAEIRRRQLATIHVATKQLGMDRDTYMALLRRVAGVDSAAQLNGYQRAAVIEELRRLGAARPAGLAARYPGKPHNYDSTAMPELIAKVQALLTDMRLPWSYADAIAKQQFGIARVAWVRDPAQLRAIVAALHVEQEKRTLDEAVSRELKRLGWEPGRVVELLKPLRPNWRRHRPSLRLVLDFLTSQEALHAAP